MVTRSAADVAHATRVALAAAGFVRHARGGTVWWESQKEGIAPSAAPVVLIHGVNDQAGTWFPIAPAVAVRRRVIIPDLPGHGESEPREGDLPISMFVGRLEALLADEPPAILVGNSLGGWIVTLYALRHPDRLEHLVLEASGGLDRPFASPVVAHDRAEAEVVLRAVHGPRFVAAEWIIDALLERATDSQMLRIRETEEHYVDSRLHELKVPTTIIWGKDDGVLPVAYAEELRDAIPHATLHVIPDAAHIPHLQQPERFLACLTAIC